MTIKNISLNNEPVELRPGSTYIIIDALYLNEIRENISTLRTNNIIKELRNKVFTYSDTPFAEYIPTSGTFTLDQIKKMDYDEKDAPGINVLSTDSGVLIFINEKIFIDFTLKFDYEELVNSQIELINLDYWNSIVNGYNLLDLAVVVAPGINCGYDFDGSGTYKIG